MAYIYHCGYGQFSRFLRKLVEIVKKNLIKFQMGTRIRGNASDKPLTTGEQERRKVKKKGKK